MLPRKSPPRTHYPHHVSRKPVNSSIGPWSDLIDPMLTPATTRLEQFRYWNSQQLRELLERRGPERQPVSRHQTTNNSHRVHGAREILQSKLQSYVFQNMPIRLIKLPEMELMERNEVVSYLMKCFDKVSDTAARRTAAGETAQRPRKLDMRDKAISAWLHEVTKFAILSHTWWQEEPSYNNFGEQRELNRKGKGALKGYSRKLLQFCNIACRVYGVEFAWADTVCIDKSSSTELDESIRSMFAWYLHSHVCIAYLAETTDLTDCLSDRWFTRGWTLQEILAPRRLKFYNRDWHPLTNFLNDKIGRFDEEGLKHGGRIDPNSSYSHQFHLLHHAIFMATGMDMTTIHRFRPGIHSPSLPERMKWVARRVTARAEDKAYCMMGVFGVSMSIAYGEGAERAFFRLFAAILKVGYSRDWFMWGGRPIPWEVHPSRMIPSSPECYLSRENIEQCDLTRMNPQEGEPITLTNLGLPMKMLVVPARISYNHDPRTYYQLTNIRISCPLSNEPVIVQGKASDWDGESQGMVTSPQFALGILNIVSLNMNDVPKHLFAVLLRRPVQETRWAAESRWTYSKWGKWETEKALVFRCSTRLARMGVNSWSRMLISRSEVRWSERGDEPKIRLQTLYL